MSSLSKFLTASASIGILFGIVLVAAPQYLIVLYELPGGTGSEIFARLLGAFLLGLNIPTWMERASPASEGAAFAVLAGAIADTLGFAVALGVVLGHIGAPSLWSVVLIFGIFSLGFLYFIFAGGVRVRTR